MLDNKGNWITLSGLDFLTSYANDGILWTLLFFKEENYITFIDPDLVSKDCSNQFEANLTDNSLLDHLQTINSPVTYFELKFNF
jgi:hypothetical protein